MPTPLSRYQQAPAQNYIAKPFMVQTIRQAIATTWVRRIPGKAGICVGLAALNRHGRGGGGERKLMSAGAASKCISCQTGCIGSDYTSCGASVESHCSMWTHPLQ